MKVFWAGDFLPSRYYPPDESRGAFLAVELRRFEEKGFTGYLYFLVPAAYSYVAMIDKVFLPIFRLPRGGLCT